MQRPAFGIGLAFGGLRAALLLLVLCAADPAQAQVRYGGGDGRSTAQAVVISGATGDFAGVQAEYAWLAEHYPGYQMQDQGLLHLRDHYYDLLQFRHAGVVQRIYFDITDFFGKS